MKTVVVVTDKPYLGQKIRFALMDKCAVRISDKTEGEYDICLWDIDFKDAPNIKKLFTMSYKKAANLPLPCSFEALEALVSDRENKAISLSGRTCYIRGEAVKLTELEAALLSLLMQKEGEFVSRDEILSEIWGDKAEAGIINVYIHYLREKLERGEKIILSSRKQGYKIDKKYLGGRDAENN